MELLAIEEAAELLGISRSGLAKWRSAGSGPAFIKIGRAVRYSREDVDQWLAARRRTTTWAPSNNSGRASQVA